VIQLRLPIVIGIVFVAAGCAQQPAGTDQTVGARAAYYGVSPQLLKMAGNYGYLPQISHGKTLFCRDQESTGSDIDETQCVDAAHLKSHLDREAGEGREDQRQLERAPGVCSPTQCGAP
jgi:hypothetical protein